MSAILYYLALPFIYLVSLLPFPLLYAVSNVMYLVLYYVAGYRKKVVMTNLRNAFPSKSEEELRHIAKRFYLYLCDLILEILKTLTISRREAAKRCNFSPESLSLFRRYAAEKKSIILVIGHWGNWEWSGKSFTLAGLQQLYVIYHPLRSKGFNRLFYRLRGRFGTKMIAMHDTLREMLRLRNEPSATAFLSDQAPPPEGAYWTTFLNQDTPVYNGTEKIARKLNFPVVYARVERVRRGYYTISAETVSDEPAKTEEGEITIRHTRLLEKDIIAKPEIWLWSHRRWKHKRPVHK